MEERHHIPLELQVDILSRLPLKQLLRFSCVSKWWNSEIRSPSFSKIYQLLGKEPDASSSDGRYVIMMTESSVFSYDFHSNILTELCPPPKLSIYTSSYNGLLLFFNWKPLSKGCYDCSLYNPLNGGYPCLSPLVVDRMDHPGPDYSEIHASGFNVGFGYDKVSDDYKILRLIHYNVREGSQINYAKRPEAAYLYSMKKNSWKLIQPDPNCEYQLKIICEGNAMVYCNNALHWISVGPLLFEVLLTALDLGTERKYKLPLPDQKVSFRRTKVAALKGCLHLIIVDDLTVDANLVYGIWSIWIMREYGVKQSWTKLFQCSLNDIRPFYRFYFIWWFRDVLPYAYSKDGDEILAGTCHYPHKFFSFNIKTQEIREVELGPVLCPKNYPFDSSLVATLPWVPSLAYPGYN